MGESAKKRVRGKAIGRIVRVVVVLGILLLAAVPVFGQEDGLTISVSKQFGYNMGSQIQGTFKVRARGSDDLVSVVFVVDDEVLAVVDTAPFETTFETGDYDPGWHAVSAMGETIEGAALKSRALNYQFVSSETANKSMVRLMVPILVLVVGAIVLTGVMPLITGHKTQPYDPETYTPGETRSYGALGGTVCPKCARPFGMHWWGLNISFVGKYDRCPHCGKWGLVRRASRETLMVAEAAEYAAYVEEEVSPRPQVSEEERLRRQVEDSRYTEL